MVQKSGDHQLIWHIHHYLQGFILSRWLFGISSLNYVLWYYLQYKIHPRMYVTLPGLPQVKVLVWDLHQQCLSSTSHRPMFFFGSRGFRGCHAKKTPLNSWTKPHQITITSIKAWTIYLLSIWKCCIRARICSWICMQSSCLRTQHPPSRDIDYCYQC